ncbi:membrane protein [Saccharopolyspora lacisalsi]|uniref:Membrane protein n=1 Tax=Halosaccharopolyspora lacisalsi TaxID=1000566 RepID=A0A839E3I8_9PSEU|nr:YihY/virulence factor BrkB family protein [Halosaccharopolyspora lacisalsi]MBA8827429.1 membrane protein [Halosaccharopolyspora lacisalsi]
MSPNEVAGHADRCRRAGPGAHSGRWADRPSQIPLRGWRQILVRAWKAGSADNIYMLAGSVAFFTFLAIFPAMISLLTVFGLVADPTQAARRIGVYTSSLPQAPQQLINDQLAAVARGGGGSLGLGLVLSLLIALWLASTGTQSLINAVNIAYDEEEGRGAVKLGALAVGLTLCGAVFVLLALALIAVTPAVLGGLDFGPGVLVTAEVVRWLLLVALFAVALAVVYRVAPDRVAPRVRWVSVGAVVATALWLLGSVAFTLYITNFGSYNKTYGALAGVVVLMLWLYLTSYVVLLGAEINAESERQTNRDTTRG